jgi:hypothetical protein
MASKPVNPRRKTKSRIFVSNDFVFYLLLALHQRRYEDVADFVKEVNLNQFVHSENKYIFHYMVDKIVPDPITKKIPILDIRFILLFLKYDAHPDILDINRETVREKILKLGYKIEGKYLSVYAPKSYPPPLYADEIELKIFNSYRHGQYNLAELSV